MRKEQSNAKTEAHAGSQTLTGHVEKAREEEWDPPTTRI
jgi:hypothetical protein